MTRGDLPAPSALHGTRNWNGGGRPHRFAFLHAGASSFVFTFGPSSTSTVGATQNGSAGVSGLGAGRLTFDLDDPEPGTVCPGACSHSLLDLLHNLLRYSLCSRAGGASSHTRRRAGHTRRRAARTCCVSYCAVAFLTPGLMISSVGRNRGRRFFSLCTSGRVSSGAAHSVRGAGSAGRLGPASSSSRTSSAA